jgi:hypothetical protein
MSPRDARPGAGAQHPGTQELRNSGTQELRERHDTTLFFAFPPVDTPLIRDLRVFSHQTTSLFQSPGPPLLRFDGEPTAPQHPSAAVVTSAIPSELSSVLHRPVESAVRTGSPGQGRQASVTSPHCIYRVLQGFASSELHSLARLDGHRFAGRRIATRTFGSVRNGEVAEADQSALTKARGITVAV